MARAGASLRPVTVSVRVVVDVRPAGVGDRVGEHVHTAFAVVQASGPRSFGCVAVRAIGIELQAAPGAGQGLADGTVPLTPLNATADTLRLNRLSGSVSASSAQDDTIGGSRNHQSGVFVGAAGVGVGDGRVIDGPHIDCHVGHVGRTGGVGDGVVELGRDRCRSARSRIEGDGPIGVHASASPMVNGCGVGDRPPGCPR